MRGIASGAGFTGSALDIAVAVAKAESGWIVDNVNKSSGASGLWQVLPSAHPEYDVNRLRSDPYYNAAAAWEISGHGTNWKPWVAFTSKAYQKYMTTGGAVANTGFGTNYVYSVNLAGTQSKGSVLSGVQVPFDPRMRSIHRPAQTRYTPAVHHGTIESDSAGQGGKLEFLFNPSEISVSYSGDPTKIPSGQDDPAQQGLPLSSNSIISFKLYFDRTFEMLKGGGIGVMTDVMALERLCGISPERPFMQLNRVKINLGMAQEFRFFGVIQNFTVLYSHFNPGMTPFRCGIDVSATRLMATQNPTDPSQWYKDPNAPEKTPLQAAADTAGLTPSQVVTNLYMGQTPSGTTTTTKPASPAAAAANAYMGK